MLMYFRERIGSDEFNSRIETYKKNAYNTSAIWGIDRNAPEAYTALLEIKLGEEQFEDFLRLVLEYKVNTTDKLLKLVDNEISTEI